MTVRIAHHNGAAALARWALWLALAFSGLAMAQAEPTLDQVYQAAQAGHVEQALQLMQPVLEAHPNSAKAHFVESELLARQGRASLARDALAQAERLAPGLPFAKPEAVQSLRRQLASPQAAAARTSALAPAAPVPASGSSLPWGVLLAVGGGALVAWMLMRLGRPAAGAAAGAAPAAPQGWAVPGMNTAMPPGPVATPAAAPVGFGRQMAGGLATGLAVGAGVMAAESIGRNLFGTSAHAATAPEQAMPSAYDPVFGNTAVNTDMGGNDFGVNDIGSWDDSAVGGGSSDWDT
ncbi:tetratricopeptide repeat protein [Pseudorhodoferax sp. Leaf267]|uniref:tetratricopeptide repeat protein n=1 Tax=Pseudorhodoferax sp. Leaf267 TaxID=1736316 RepID=UPI0006FE1022|nr:tetratricopeptide repeat protein [Pseudorhodoferax sp. Leaf267]KQP22464.1 hypothetical protein ASF43_00585 [Pseudorhodoferax sp. Leaf267]